MNASESNGSGDLQGRICVVTGATGGIGTAVARRLASDGVRLGLVHHTNHERAAELSAEFSRVGADVVTVAADLADPADASRAVRRIAEVLGPPELLVHSAGVSAVEPATSVTWQSWRASIAVNLDAAFNIIYAVKDMMLNQRFGRIVAMSSISALRERKDQIPYSVAKAGVIALIRCCAEAWAPFNIRLNTVCPGLIDTGRLIHFDQAFRDTVVAGTPMGRLGRPEEIASLTRFLLSEESSYITGQAVVASGGRVMLPG